MQIDGRHLPRIALNTSSRWALVQTCGCRKAQLTYEGGTQMKVNFTVGFFLFFASFSVFSETPPNLHTQALNSRASAGENCSEAVRVACAYLEGCRVGYRSCEPKLRGSSACWTELKKQFTSLTPAKCSQWIHVNSENDSPFECYLGAPKRLKNGQKPQSFLVSQLPKN